MHLPDHYLDPTTCLACGALATGGVAWAAYQARSSSTKARAARFAAVTAGIFASQMLNFPVAAEASGHLLGGALATFLLGPSLAVLSLTIVLAVQAVVFADGGMMALGANVLNMALIAPGVAYGVQRLLAKDHASTVQLIGIAALASWLSVMAAAAACSLEMAVGSLQTLGEVLPAMLRAHALIGLGESVLTTVAVVALSRSFTITWSARRWITTGLAAALVMAVALAPWASPLPDGLEHTAGTLGFIEPEVTSASFSPLPDYAWPGIEGSLTVSLAGAIGVLAVFVAAYALSQVLPGRRNASRA